MNKVRFVAVIFLALVFAIPPGAGLVEARAPDAVSLVSYIPGGGNWSGANSKTFPVSFTVNATGTTWTQFFTRTIINISGVCKVSISANPQGPGVVSSGKFSGTSGAFRFAGTFTSTSTASGTYSWTNVNGIKNCSQSGTWTAKLPFSKLSPVNGVTNWSISPILTWSANAGATGYLYCIDTVNDSACNTSWVSVGTHTSVALTGLLQSTPYYWQVRSTKGTIITPANGGTWWSFTTGILPAAFGKSSPTTGATNQAIATLLSWTPSTGATGYVYCVDTINDGLCNTAWRTAGNVPSVAAPNLLPGKTYYWQVRATNSAGAVPADSGTWWSFATIPPSIFTLKSIGSLDGWILESTSTSGVGGTTMNATLPSFVLGDDARNRQYRSILYFKTGTLPSTAVITGVTLKFRRNAGTLSNPFATLGNIVADIRTGIFGTSPALQATDFQAGANKSAVLTFTNTPSGGWYSQSLSSANFVYINRAGPTQFRLRFAKDSNNNSAADYWTFFSGDAAALNQPQLVIQYYTP